MDFYDIHTRQWSNIKFKGGITLPDIGFQTIEGHDNKLYVIGGKRGAKYLKDTFLFNEETKALMKCSQLNTERSYHGSSIIGLSDICVIGGENVTPYLSSCEIYHSKIDTWEKIADLNEKRLSMGCCCLESNYIYVIAGFNEKYLSSIERYCLSLPDQGWKILEIEKTSKKFTPRQNCAVVPLNDSKILIFGGYNDKLLNDTFVFISNESIIQETEPMKKPEEFITYAYDFRDAYMFCLSNDIIHRYNINEGKWIAQNHDISLLDLNLS